MTTLDVIEIELSDFYLPHMIDLSVLFETRDLNYQVEVKTAGVVDVDSIRPNGMLFLIANPSARSGQCSKITVRAVGIDGCSIATSFDVVVVDLQAAA